MKVPYKYFKITIGNEVFYKIERSAKKAVEAALKEASPPPFYTIKVYEYENGEYLFITEMGGAL
jgi:hypothetical protein